MSDPQAAPRATPHPAFYVDAAGVVHNARILSEPDETGRCLLLVAFSKAARFELMRARESRSREAGAFFRPVAPS